jgi:hypothetical protein
VAHAIHQGKDGSASATKTSSPRSFVLFAVMTWFFYLRKSFAVEKVPSLAYASV